MCKEWKDSCVVSSMCGVLVLPGGGITALLSAVSMA